MELPRYLAASNLQVIKQVIEKGLESERHDLRCESLQFFEYIPPNTDRREKMIKCKKISKSNDPDDWLGFMYASGFDSQGLYYGLKIMKSIMVATDRKMSKKDYEAFFENKRSFFKKFNECDGFPLLCQTLKALKVETILKDVVWLSVFQMLVHILELMLEDKDFTSSIPKSKQEAFFSSTSQLVKQITEILSTVSKNVSLKRDLRDHLFSDEEVKTISEEKINNIVEEYEILETDFYSYLIRVLKS